MVNYPAQIDTSISLPVAIDNSTPVQASVFNKLRDAVIAIEAELGVKPSATYGTVSNRLGTLENIVGNLRIIELEQDLGGTLESPLVIGLQGHPISDLLPTPGQVLAWNGIAWQPASVSGAGTSPIGSAGGDLSGLYPNPTVAGLQGRSVASTTPTDGYVLTWIESISKWSPQILPPPVTSVQSGYNYGPFLNIPISSTIPNTNSTTFVTYGTFEFDPTKLTGTGGGTRTIKLRVIAETTGFLMSIQLFNVTNSSVVAGSALATSSTIPVSLVTGDLTANLTNGLAVYQVQMKMGAGGGVSDRITLDMANLKVEWV